MTRNEAIKQLDWYFNEDDGIAADGKTHAAYATLRIIVFGHDGYTIKNRDPIMVCPSCGKVAGWNSYFTSYICPVCGWKGGVYQE